MRKEKKRIKEKREMKEKKEKEINFKMKRDK
jgi:hypothetical protein